ncbi:MAG TPA: glycosyltransferase [Terriglobia bacterium]|nr:glycosyltransferase [Terriglobia bacterium]
MPTVSVIVPNYNHARFLRKRIDSVLRQTFQDFELILLDDCSTDDSRSILSSYAADPRVRIEFNDANSGSTFKQWNKGVRLARGEYVWIAESDDYADPRLLERLIAVLGSDPQVVFVNCRSWRVYADDRVDGYADSHLVALNPDKWANDFSADGREECRNYFVHLNPVFNASSVLFRKAVYDEVQGADESLHFCGDWKLWAAMALKGQVAHISEPLNYYRVHDATVTEASKQEGLAGAEYLRVIRWLLGHVTPTEAARKKLSETVSWSWAPAVTVWRVPLRRRCLILRDAIAIDPHTLRQMIRFGLGTLRRKFLRQWRSIRSGANPT